MTMKFYFLLLIVTVICGCTSRQKNENVTDDRAEDSFFTIDFPLLLSNSREVPLSGIAESIEYIPLETNGISVLGRINDVKFSKDYIFIHSFGNILLSQFDRNGKFIRYIGKEGRGPGEYALIRMFSLDEENRLIYIHPNWSRGLLVYSFDGEYLKTIPFIRDERRITWSRDSLFICFSEPSVGNEENVFTEINSKGEVLQTVKNYCLWSPPPPFGRSNVYPGQNPFYRLGNRLHFKGEYNDTVYTYDKNNRIVPNYFIDLKEYKLPPEMRIERGLVKRIPVKYFWVNATESSRFVFVLYCAYDTNDAEGHGDINGGYLIYDKQTGTGNVLNNPDGKLVQFNIVGDVGFENDIDGGPEFIPAFSNDSLAFRLISAIEMKKYIGSDKFNESNPLYQDKKKSLTEQMKTIKETDNDILIVVRLKK
jgi:hypothetical protein